MPDRDDVARAAAAKALEVASRAIQTAQSIRGEKGDKGDPGEIQVLNVPVPGPKGDRGDVGPQGPEGPRGFTGPKGEKGETGDKGDKGDKGDVGPVGPAGKDGKDGQRGDVGATGPAGPVGEQGPMPKHEKKGVMIRFEKAPGEWGEWIVMPVGGGGGGRDDKLTDRQKELVALADGYKNQNLDLTVNSIAVNAPTTDATFTNDTGITGWVYSGKSFSVIGQESNPTGLFFKPDGTKMYVCGTTGDDVNEYTLGTAWDVSTATFIAVSTGITQDGSPIDLFFKDDGLTLFVLGQANDTVYQYTLSVAWDITTATYTSKSFSVTTQEATPQGLWFRPDGTTMYVTGNTNDTVYQYTLSTPWDISTASYANISFSVAAQESNPTQVVLSADGTKMWVLGSTGDDINEYTLGTAWNVSTASFVNNVYVGFQEVTPNGLFIDSTAANRVYICGTSNDTVYQYNTATNTVDAMTDRLFVSGEGYVDGNTFFGSNVVVDGTFGVQGSSAFSTTTVNGTLTASSAVNFSANTANISIGTAQTTGALSLGGTTQTGTLTVGQSTGAQTLNLGTGATTSGTTKAVNIGTAGVSGSTTNIAIGSAVSGATSRTTLNGIVIDSISAAVSAAGSTQGTATALVSNINNVTVVAAAADGVILPTATAGMRILVRNSDAADTLKIYPATGAQINALGNNASFSLTAGSTTELFASTSTQWFTF